MPAGDMAYTYAPQIANQLRGSQAPMLGTMNDEQWSQLLKMIGGTAGMVNPWVSAGFGAAEMIGKLFGAESQAEKSAKKRSKTAEGMIGEIKGEPTGDFLGEDDILKAMALAKQNLKPAFDKMGFSAGRFAGVQSPQYFRMLMERIAPMLAGKEFDLRSESRELGFRRDMGNKQIRASLIGSL